MIFTFVWTHANTDRNLTLLLKWSLQSLRSTLPITNTRLRYVVYTFHVRNQKICSKSSGAAEWSKRVKYDSLYLNNFNGNSVSPFLWFYYIFQIYQIFQHWQVGVLPQWRCSGVVWWYLLPAIIILIKVVVEFWKRWFDLSR